MENQVINYETMLKVAKSISHSKDPEEVALMTVDSIKTALDVKGCALFLFNRKTDELELATSFGLSDEYINKGPVSACVPLPSPWRMGRWPFMMLRTIPGSSILKKPGKRESPPFFRSPLSLAAI